MTAETNFPPHATEERCGILDLKCFSGDFPKWSRTFIEFIELSEFDKSLKHELGSILRSCSNMCLAGNAVTFWTLKQDVPCSSPFTVITNVKHLGKTPM